MNKVFKRYFSLFLTWAPFIVHKRPTTCLTVSVYWSSWCQNLWYLFCFVLHLYLLFCCCLFYYLYSMASSRKVCQWLGAGRWFSPGIPVSSTNKTDRHDITEILLKIKHHNPNHNPIMNNNPAHSENKREESKDACIKKLYWRCLKSYEMPTLKKI
jgi:hypothetical protein